MWIMQATVATLCLMIMFNGIYLPGFGTVLKLRANSPKKLSNIYVIKHPGAIPNTQVLAGIYAFGPFETMAMNDADEEFAAAAGGNNAKLVTGTGGAQMPIYRLSLGSGGMLNSSWAALNGRLAEAPVYSSIAMYLVNSFTSIMYATFNTAEVLYVDRFNSFNNENAVKSGEKKVGLVAPAKESFYAALLDGVESVVQKTSTLFEFNNGSSENTAYAATSGTSSTIRLEPLGEASVSVNALDVTEMITHPIDLPDLSYDEFSQRLVGSSSSEGIGIESSSEFAERYHANGGSGDPLRKGAMFGIGAASCLTNVQAPLIGKSAAIFHPAYFQPSDRITGRLTNESGSCAVPLFGGLCLDDFITAVTGSNGNFEFQDALSALGNMASQEWNFDVPEWTLETPSTISLQSTLSALESVDVEQFPEMKPCVELGKDLVALDLTKLEMNEDFIAETDSRFADRDAHVEMYNAIAGIENKSRDDDDGFYAISIDTPGSLDGSGGNMSGGADSNMASLGSAMRSIASVLTTNYNPMQLEQDTSHTPVEEKSKTTGIVQSVLDFGQTVNNWTVVGLGKRAAEFGAGVGKAAWDGGLSGMKDHVTEGIKDAAFSGLEMIMTPFSLIPILAILLLHTIAYYTTIFTAGIFVVLFLVWIGLACIKLFMGTSDDDTRPLGIAIFPIGSLFAFVALIGVTLAIFPFISADCMLFMKMARTSLATATTGILSGFVAGVSGSQGMVETGMDLFTIAMKPLAEIIGISLIPGILMSLLRGNPYHPQSTTSGASAVLRSAGNPTGGASGLMSTVTRLSGKSKTPSGSA